MQDEKSDVENPIKELGKQAKYTLTNNGTQEEFVEQIENMLKEIKHES